jgi:single-strand DNA-binding protein
MLIGRLGADPEIRTTTNGTGVCEMRIATNESWFDKQSNERKERTEWHRVIVWGKSGENCAKYLSKGSQAYVEGRIQTREWNDKEGNKRYTTEIVSSSVQFLSGRGDSNGGKAPASGPGFVTAGQAVSQLRSRRAETKSQFNDDGIPF